MSKQINIETLESLVALNKTPEAIEQLKTLLSTFNTRYETDLRAMEGRANSLKWQSMRGTADYKDISLEERNINFSFLSLLNELRSELSLALLAFELMVGKPLFDGKSIPEIMRQRERFYANPEIRDYLPADLKEPKFDIFWQIIGQMLRNEPGERFESLSIVYNNLQKLKPSADHDHEIALASYNRCLANKPQGRDFITAF